ncbi:MAG: CHASE2 domain-containing protein, partial [Desulfamplus sp.]|nr:CHASE2 domain-containing protein [Desulfamplus sp.]
MKLKSVFVKKNIEIKSVSVQKDINFQSVSVRREWIQGIFGGLAAGLVALVFWGSGFMDVWEGKTWDWRESLMARPSSATDDICLIVVDQTSLDWMKENNGLTWPWPREIYSVVVDFCKRNQAKAVAFDVLFTEASTYGVNDDQIFGKAVANYGKVASAAFLKKLSGSHTTWPEDTTFSPIKIEGIQSWLTSSSGQACVFPRAAMPIPELTSTSAMLCNVQQEPDPDSIYRRARIISLFDNHVVPSLGLGIYFAGKNEPHIINQKNSSASTGNLTPQGQSAITQNVSMPQIQGGITQNALMPQIQGGITQNALKIENCTIPLDKKGEAILRYRGPSGTHKTY